MWSQAVQLDRPDPLINRLRLAVVLAASILVGGCESTPATDPNADPERPQVDIAEVLTLMLGLREYEIQLSFSNRVQAPILAAPADLYHYNGEDVRLIILHIGSDASMELALSDMLGRQIAGV